MADQPLIRIRKARFPADAEAIAALDTSFKTDKIYLPKNNDLSFDLELVALPTPLTKSYPPIGDPDSGTPVGEFACVAEDSGRICGFVSGEYRPWNRRLTIWNFCVDLEDRGRGIGRELMEVAAAYGRNSGAMAMWVETQNVNVPAIAAYRALGFELCGLDTSLYVGTPAEGEVAVFLSRRLGIA